MKLTDSQKDRIVLKKLKHDLKNVEYEIDNMHSYVGYYAPIAKQHKKNVKMLKRAINFYSVEEPYDEV